MAGMMQGQGAVSPFKIGAWRIYEPYLEKKSMFAQKIHLTLPLLSLCGKQISEYHF